MNRALLGGLVGAAFGAGLFVIVAGWLGQFERRRRVAAPPPARLDRLAWRFGLTAAGVAVAAWWTRWPAAMAALGLLGWTAPSFAGLQARRRRQLARSEAIAVWAEMLRDLLVSNAGLHEAIGKSARVAPAVIRSEVTALYVRAQRGDLSTALSRFAADLDDPIADTVVVALQIADQRAVSDLGSMLTAVAASTRDTVAMQLRINAARARTYRTAQLITVVVGFFVGLLVLANRDYMEPFGTDNALVSGVLTRAGGRRSLTVRGEPVHSLDRGPLEVKSPVEFGEQGCARLAHLPSRFGWSEEPPLLAEAVARLSSRVVSRSPRRRDLMNRSGPASSVGSFAPEGGGQRDSSRRWSRRLPNA